MEVREEGGHIPIIATICCHHQNDSCIKMGSDESHFNVSLIVRDKSHETMSTDQLLQRKESRNGFEPRSLRFPA